MIAIDMEMPKYCLEVTTQLFYSDEIVYNYCSFYNICKHRETIEANVKPYDCPLMKIITCEDCKYWHNDDGVTATCVKNIGRVSHGFPKDYFCADAERRE